ncbi:MAG: methylated-DNA--[protein]-cysteine S-methyltransferase [Gammaproteobacteria bacterium]|nr:methylated-DNA--[protein]-cysteine S-methyltransferase [Gammaproteobacteria bacterium]
MKPTADSADAIVPFMLTGQALSLAIYTTGHDHDAVLCGIDFLFEQTVTQVPHTALAENVVYQLQRYLDDPQWSFDVPLHMQGTKFQRRLWSALCDVPSGNTATYGQLVKQLGMKGGAQAVGQACRRNPVPVVVPCHRILSQSGMGGYAGETAGEKLRFKQALLEHEGFVSV